MNRLFGLLFFFIWSSCTTQESLPTFSTLAIGNSWKAGYVRDNNNIITSLYNGWLFTFNSDGTFLVTGGGTTMNGTWEENVPARKIKLLISSATLQAVFLSKEWDISFLTPMRLKLADNRFSPMQEFYLDKP